MDGKEYRNDLRFTRIEAAIEAIINGNLAGDEGVTDIYQRAWERLNGYSE